MEDKRKLLVFDRSEVILIFVFVILMSILTFTFGVKIGRNITYNRDGFTSEDEQEIQTLKSTQEEAADKSIKELNQKEHTKSVDSAYVKQLQEEFKKLEKEDPDMAATTAKENLDVAQAAKMEEEKNKLLEAQAKAQESEQLSQKFVGKYTIQLGSYSSAKEAEAFAEGFAVRGYNPIVNEVKIEGKGLWYRVSLGAFESKGEAKEYIKAEASLFNGQDYIISEIK